MASGFPTCVQGRVIESQFAIGDRYLVVLSDDVPYEERLSFHLFDARARLVDALELGAPYVPGAFRLVGTHDDGLTFTFEGERRYTLRVFDSPRRLVGSAPGVRRAGGPLRPHLLQLRTA